MCWEFCCIFPSLRGKADVVAPRLGSSGIEAKD